jgi:hypothetical protein
VKFLSSKKHFSEAKPFKTPIIEEEPMEREHRHTVLLSIVAIAAITAIVALTMTGGPSGTLSGQAANYIEEELQEGEILTAEELGYAPDRVIVGFTAGVSEQEQERIVRGVGGKEKRNIKGVARVIEVPPQARAKVEAALKNRPGVAFAEPDYLVTPEAVPNDPNIGSQYHINLMRFPQAWDLANHGTVIAAAPDTGVQLNHPDMAGVFLTNLALNTVDNTQNVAYQHNHGVKTAGVLGTATGNGVGIASAAWNMKQIPYKISNMDTGSAYTSDMVEAIRHAADNGARVVSLSFGPSGASYDTSSTIRSAGAYLE